MLGNHEFENDPPASLEAELAQAIPEWFPVVKKELHSYLYHGGLLPNFHRVKILRDHLESVSTSKGARTPQQLWLEIIETCLDTFDDAFAKDGELMANALFHMMRLSGFQHQVEGYSLLDIVGGLQISTPEDTLRRILLFYHEVYDGRYKFAVSYLHFATDISDNSRDSKKSFDCYLDDDVSFKLKKLSKGSRPVGSIHDLEPVFTGANSHIRDAIAHKRWSFSDGKVTLTNRDGWEQSFDREALETVVKELTLARDGLEAAILIAFASHQADIKHYVVKPVYDINAIRKVILESAKREGFDQVSVDDSNEGKLLCVLFDHSHRSSDPSTPGQVEETGTSKVSHWIARGSRAAQSCVDVLRGYDFLTIQMRDYLNNLVGTVNVDVKAWFEVIDGQEDKTKGQSDSI